MGIERVSTTILICAKSRQDSGPPFVYSSIRHGHTSLRESTEYDEYHHQCIKHSASRSDEEDRKRRGGDAADRADLRRTTDPIIMYVMSRAVLPSTRIDHTWEAAKEHVQHMQERPARCEEWVFHLSSTSHDLLFAEAPVAPRTDDQPTGRRSHSAPLSGRYRSVY